MKKTLIAVLVLCFISSFFMIRFYIASVDIYHQFVNEHTLTYLKRVSNIENLPEWTTIKSLWHDISIDYLIRIVFMLVILWVTVKLIQKKNKMIITLFILLGLSIGSFFSMLLNFAASHDIYNEYVNVNITQIVNNTDNLASMPAWTTCSMEWGITLIDYIGRIIYMIFVSIVLVKLIVEKDKPVAYK